MRDSAGRGAKKNERRLWRPNFGKSRRGPGLRLLFNYECLADVVETQNFASLRVGGRYSVPWQVLLRTVIVCPCGLSRFVSPCSCESEVPFGPSKPAFFVRAVGVGNACCFR